MISRWDDWAEAFELANSTKSIKVLLKPVL